MYAGKEEVGPGGREEYQDGDEDKDGKQDDMTPPSVDVDLCVSRKPIPRRVNSPPWRP